MTPPDPLHALAAASVASRPVFWHLVGWLKVLWYVLAVTSTAVFAAGVARLVGKYRRAHGAGFPAARQLPSQLRRGVRSILTHATIRRRDRTAGAAHELI